MKLRDAVLAILATFMFWGLAVAVVELMTPPAPFPVACDHDASGPHMHYILGDTLRAHVGDICDTGPAAHSRGQFVMKVVGAP